MYQDNIPEILFISSFPPRECGIATYSADLIKALRDSFSRSFKISVCALETPSEKHSYSEDVKYTLDTTDPLAYNEIADYINRDSRIAMTVIQHEFGFFHEQEERFRRFLFSLVKPVMIVFHTVLPSPDEKMKKNVQNLVAATDGVIVMTENSKNMLSDFYDVPRSKISVIQHGTHLVPHLDKKMLKKKYNLTNKKVLATFGLLSSNKGIETTLNALPGIISKHPETIFLIIGKFSLLDTSTTTGTSSTVGNEWGFMLGKRTTTAPYDGCQNVTINNCTISLNPYQSTSTGIYSAHANPSSTSISTSSYNATSANSFNTFTGNTISNVSRGIYLLGSSSSVTYYDKNNKIGGTTAATGNTVTVGGTTNTNTLYGFYVQYDSVITVQNNKFYVATGNANSTKYGFYASTGRGTLNVLNNLFNLACSNTTSSIYAMYNSGHNDATGDRSWIGNEVTGNITTLTSGSMYAIYDYSIPVSTLTMDNNYVHDMDLGTGSGSVYVFYAGANTIAKKIQTSGNRINHMKKLGTLTYFYAMYNGYQYNAQPGSVAIIENNKIRNIQTSANYLYLNYNYGNTSYSTNTPPRLTHRFNLYDSLDCSTAPSYNYFYNYMMYYVGDSSVVSYDTMSNWIGSMSTSGYTYFYTYNYQYYGLKGSRFSNNYINNWIGNYSYAYIYDYYVQFADSNNFNNISLGVNGSPNNYVYNYLGMYGTNGFCRYNKLYNFSVNSSGGIYNGLGYYGSNYQVHNNSVRRMSVQNGSNQNYIGYYCTGANVHDNRIDSLIATGSGSLYGYYSYVYGANDTSYNNVVSRLMSVGTGTGNSLYGYYLGHSASGYAHYFYNNEIANIEVPSAYNSSSIYGIYTGGTGDYKLYNNTVRISPTSSPSGASYGATGIYYSSSSGTLDLRNNIINVNVTPGTSGTVAALRRSSGTTGTPPTNFLGSSNSNIYYAPNTTNSWLYAEGTSATAVNTYNLTNDPAFNTTCGLFKSWIGHDAASFTENNLVSSGTVPNAYVPSGVSFAESNAAPTVAPTVSFDLANVTRSNPADCGALQFNGTMIDQAAPQIGYTPLPAITYCLSTPTIVATITDQTGVDTTAGNKPKLYYKKSTESNAFGGANNNTFNGWKWVEPTSISGTTYTFDMDYSKLFSTIAAGNTIQYFIMAQDTKSTPNAGANLAAFATCPTSVNLVAANAPVASVPAPYQFTINSASLFTVTADLANLCVSGSTTLHLSPIAYGTALQWESATPTGSFTAITGATGQNYTTPVLTSSMRYRVVINCGSSVLTTTTPVTVTVNNPTIVSTTPATRCGYGQVTLSAATGSPTTTVNWYSSATSTTPLATGNAFLTPSLGSSVTYYAAAVVPKGSTEKIDLGPIITPYPSYFSPVGYGMGFHFSDTTNFYSTDVYANGTGSLYVELQDVATGNPVYSAGPFTLTGTTGNYGNTKTTIPLNFMNIPPGDYKLVVVSPTPSTLYLWVHYYLSYNPTFTFPYYSNVTGRSWAMGGVYPGQTFPYPSYWFFFFNNILSGPCENPVRTPVTATITPATPIAASSPNSPGICAGSSATVTATSTNGTYLYTWNPGSMTGATQTVSPTTTTTYVVNAVDALTGCTAIDSVKLYVNPQQLPPVLSPTNQTICQGSAVQLTATPQTSFGGVSTVGTGTLTNTTSTYPAAGMGQYYTADHEQYLITAAELTAAGVVAGQVFSIAFNHSASYIGAPMQQFTVKMGHTTNTSASLTFVCSGLTTVYGPATYSPTGSGWLTIPFSTPFIWNGTSNVIVDVSHSNAGASCAVNYTDNATVYQSSTSFTSSAYYYDDGNCTVQNCAPSGALTGTATRRPNMRFGWGYPYTVNWTPNVTGLYKSFPPAAGPMTTADTNTRVWASPTTTQVYTAVVNAQGCMSLPSNPDTVFVNPAPSTIITPAGPQAICAGGSVTLCVPTSATYTYQWYNGAVAIGGATSSCYTATGAGNYTVTVTNLATGCSATSIPTLVIVNPLPTASISASGPTTFCNGGSVVLGPVVTNASPGAIQWYNGSGPISGATGTSYTATQSGTYYVKVTNGNQCVGTSNSITVTVNTVPSNVTPNGSTTFCSGGSVQFCAPTTGTGAPFTYQWYQGATSLGPTATDSCYTATTSGNYYVVISSASTGCSATSASFTVTVGSAPSSTITPATSQFLCSNGTLTLCTNPSPGLTYQWNKGGSPISAAAEPSAVTSCLTIGNNAATGPGSYTVTVTITGSSPVCSATTTTPVVVTASTAPTSTFTASGTTTCAGTPITLTYTGTGGTTFLWKLNGSPAPGTNTGNTYSATTGGSYTLTATNAAGCSATSAATTISINPLPTIAVTSAGPTNICTGGSVVLNASPATFSTYQWKNGSTVVGSSSSYTATANGSYTVTVTDANGCQNTSTPVAVVVNPLPSATITPAGPQNICSGSSVTICTSTSANTTQIWNNGAGPITGATQGCYTTGTAGSYTVKITNTVTGCSATSSPFVLTVSPPPAASATRVGPATICQGDSSRIRANTGSGLSYQWNYNGTPLAGAIDSFYYAKQQGTYTVTVSNGNCPATSTGVTINVNPAPAAFITYNTPVNFCEGSAVALTANIGNGLTYMWYINDTVTGNSSTTFVATTTGTYKLRTTNGFSCSTFSDTLHVTVNPAPKPVIARTDVTMTTTQNYASYQWFLNNVAIGGATAQTYVALANGAYKVRVIDGNGCEGYSELEFIQNVGVTPTPVSAAIKVFPNPTSGLLKIDAPVKVQLVLRDVTGKAVIEESEVKQIDLTNVASGMYLLYISNMDGKLLRVDKVTKNTN